MQPGIAMCVCQRRKVCTFSGGNKHSFRSERDSRQGAYIVLHRFHLVSEHIVLMQRSDGAGKRNRNLFAPSVRQHSSVGRRLVVFRTAQPGGKHNRSIASLKDMHHCLRTGR